MAFDGVWGEQYTPMESLDDGFSFSPAGEDNTAQLADSNSEAVDVNDDPEKFITGTDDRVSVGNLTIPTIPWNPDRKDAAL